jgi:PAS domain S-box-containing protein
VNEVSNRAIRMLLDAVEHCGLPASGLVDGLNTSVEQLRATEQRSDWALFVRMHENLERMAGSDDRLKQIGHEMVRVPSFPVIARIAPYLTSATALHRVGAQWLVPLLFPNIAFRWREVSETRAEITCDIPLGYDGCAPFFFVCAGALEAASELGGFGRTFVETTITPRSAMFRLTSPQPVHLAQRVVRRLRALFDATSLIQQIDSHEEALAASYANSRRTRREMRGILERIPAAVLVHRDGVLIWANDAVGHILGYADARALIGRSVLDVLHPDDRSGLTQRMRARENGSRSTEFRFARRDGTFATCALEVVGDIEFEGQPARLVVGRDVTEERRLQDQLRVADRMASLGTIAAGVAHEINNPLAYVHASLLVAEQALRPFGATSDASTVDARRERESRSQRALEALDLAREGVDRVRGIVADLKSFSRPDDETLGAVFVEELIEATLSLASTQVGKRVSVERDYGNVPPVRANRARLGQVLLNLFVNAADAATDASDAFARIRVRTRTTHDERVVIEVSDTGAGISPDVVNRLFEPFVTTKAIGWGTGLGLAICKRIITQLGGQIDAESLRPSPSDTATPQTRPYRTTFRVALPIAVNAVEAQRHLRPAS